MCHGIETSCCFLWGVNRFVKGAFTKIGAASPSYGQYTGLSGDSTNGKNGIRIGDGFHNYLVVRSTSLTELASDNELYALAVAIPAPHALSLVSDGMDKCSKILLLKEM